MPKGIDPWKTVHCRFFSKIRKTKSCWFWTGNLDVNGYGQIAMGRKNLWKASRISYFLHKGEIPKKKVIMHLCDNPPCVNPLHLEAGTQSQNISHAYELHPRKLKEVCSRGHKFDGINSRGNQICKQCMNSNYKKWRQKHGNF